MASAGQDKLKILHFCECWLPQTEIWLYNHINFLPDGIDNFVVCGTTRHLDQFRVPHLFSLEELGKATRLWTKLRCRLGLQDYRETHLPFLEDVIRSVKPAVLHSHFGHYGWINARLARKYALPHVVSFYGADVGYLPHIEKQWLVRYPQMSDQVDLFLCEGPYMARSLRALGLPAEKVRVFRLGIDLTKVRFEPRRNPNDGTLRFLISASFREKKGIPYALEALGLFKKAYPDIEITVIGDSRESEREKSEKRKILDAVERCQLRGRIRFLGYQPHDILLREMYRHHVFVSPSVTSADGDSEGGAPVTIIEAAASGMPVISTTHCDIPSVLSEANRRYLAPERDSATLADAIDALVRTRDWAPIASANRRLIEDELDVREQSGKLADIYASLSKTLTFRSEIALEAVTAHR
jgi:colanic acid/amylovoran biosynthesis glycosyltransferase